MHWTHAHALTRIVWLVLLIAGGILVYAASGWLTGLHPRRVWQHLKNAN
jgi:putative peptidoglycan lipid II flippase